MGNDDFYKVRRYSNRASYNMEELIDFLNKNFIAQVAFQDGGIPFVIPMNYCNDSEYLYFHGSKESRLMNLLASGQQVAISVLQIKGIVLRSKVTDNSVQYISAVIFGKGEPIHEKDRKIAVFKNLMDRLVVGRWNDTDMPDDEDLENVEIVAIRLDKFSMKINLNDPKESNDSHRWYGVIPIIQSYGRPRSYSTYDIPEYINKLVEK